MCILWPARQKHWAPLPGTAVFRFFICGRFFFLEDTRISIEDDFVSYMTLRLICSELGAVMSQSKTYINHWSGVVINQDPGLYDLTINTTVLHSAVKAVRSWLTYNVKMSKSFMKVICQSSIPQNVPFVTKGNLVMVIDAGVNIPVFIS